MPLLCHLSISAKDVQGASMLLCCLNHDAVATCCGGPPRLRAVHQSSDNDAIHTHRCCCCLAAYITAECHHISGEGHAVLCVPQPGVVGITAGEGCL